MVYSLLNRRLLNQPTLRSKRTSLVGHVAAETLEDRIVLSAAAVAPAVDANAASELVTITDITVNDVEVTGEDELTALATVTGTALGSAFTQDVEIPMSVEATPGTEATNGCDVLNLSLGPVNLDVLGLNVNLDDCMGGPVTVDITGEEGEGNLLGNLVCGIAGLLDDGGLEGLSESDTETLTTGLTDLLGGTDTADGLFDQFLSEAETTQATQVAGNVTDILTLEIPDGLHVDLLGLKVDTSGICLNVTAEEGPGNLLGNLLGSLSGLLDQADDLGGTLEDLGTSVNGLVDALQSRLGELDLGELDVDELPDDLADSLGDLNEELNRLERLVNRLDGQDRLDDEQIEEIVGEFTDRIDELVGQIAEADVDELDDIVDDVDEVIDDIGDELKDAVKDDDDEDGEEDDNDNGGPADGLQNAIDRLNEIISRFEERGEDRFEKVIDRLNNVVDRLEELAGGDDDDGDDNEEDDSEETARAELFAGGEVNNRLLVGA